METLLFAETRLLQGRNGKCFIVRMLHLCLISIAVYLFFLFRTCSRNYSCYSHTGSNPNYNYTSFDHVGWAFLTSFQLLTLDFWEDVYNNVSLQYLFSTILLFRPFYPYACSMLVLSERKPSWAVRFRFDFLYQNR